MGAHGSAGRDRQRKTAARQATSDPAGCGLLTVSPPWRAVSGYPHGRIPGSADAPSADTWYPVLDSRTVRHDGPSRPFAGPAIQHFKPRDTIATNVPLIPLGDDQQEELRVSYPPRLNHD